MIRVSLCRQWCLISGYSATRNIWSWLVYMIILSVILVHRSIMLVSGISSPWRERTPPLLVRLYHPGIPCWHHWLPRSELQSGGATTIVLSVEAERLCNSPCRTDVRESGHFASRLKKQWLQCNIKIVTLKENGMTSSINIKIGQACLRHKMSKLMLKPKGI